MAQVYLISENTLKSESLINNNVDTMYLLPAIEYAQDSGLQPLIGTVLYKKLMTLVENNDFDNYYDYKYLLDEYIKPYLINKVQSDIQLPLAYKIRNAGVIQNTDNNMFQPSMKDTQYLIEYYDNKSKFYANRMSDYLMANKSKYPEYSSKNSCADMPSNKNAYNTHIYLG